MPDLTFAKPCTFTAPDGTQRVFAPGVHHDVPDDVADHWFIKAHLAREADAPVAPATAPLTHEERAQVKAALDAAEGRARGAEAERDAAMSSADALQAALDAERAAHEETRRLLDDATAPDAAEGDLIIRHRGRGTYAVMRGEEVVVDGLTKPEAEAKVAEMKAQA